MITLKETRQRIAADEKNWAVYLMDFVDDFRLHKSDQAVEDPFERQDGQMDALLASTAEFLCDEQHMLPPKWLSMVPACKEPWFVAGVDSIRAIALVEAPAHFRARKVFVLENFLSRV
ncbi:MAG TPA: hypothetical protein VMZ25_04515 [Terriglobales bacterium]|nr:hypothetical protein [Terriglobales bacterium]